MAELRAQPVERRVKVRHVDWPGHDLEIYAGLDLPVYMASIRSR